METQNRASMYIQKHRIQPRCTHRNIEYSLDVHTETWNTASMYTQKHRIQPRWSNGNTEYSLDVHMETQNSASVYTWNTPASVYARKHTRHRHQTVNVINTQETSLTTSRLQGQRNINL